MGRHHHLPATQTTKSLQIQHADFSDSVFLSLQNLCLFPGKPREIFQENHEMVSPESTNWLFDLGYNFDDVAVADANFAVTAPGFNWPVQHINGPPAVSAEIDASLGDSDGFKETGSKKRVRSESCSGTSSKACREKLRRDRLNDKFLELGSILEPGRPPKTDKAAILIDAVRMVTQLRGEAQKLKDSNSGLQEKIKELKAEKNELRDEKQRLKAEKEKLEQQVKAMNAQPSFLHPPPAIPAAFAAQGQAPGNKLVPFLSYPGVAMWQFMPPASVDTSQDHVVNCNFSHSRAINLSPTISYLVYNNHLLDYYRLKLPEFSLKWLPISSNFTDKLLHPQIHQPHFHKPKPSSHLHHFPPTSTTTTTASATAAVPISIPSLNSPLQAPSLQSSSTPPTSKEEAILQAKTCLSTTLEKPLNNPKLSGKLKKVKQPRYRVEIPVVDDDSSSSLSQLAFDVFKDIPSEEKGSPVKI
ncbi:hypothetical protein LWI29_014490 [Acer saccharum]|uniref:BHLH domain-containing protein n=1 Tax=Acer saccharum TaxID=4024 RepID=A0AA39T4V0_ACESA|nr:hypothetical protein LWI29_014490 [Acer saccharum]